MLKEQDIFDHQVKHTLENAEAPVPAGVWEGVSASLPKASPVPFWRFAAVAAAAAAIVAGVFIAIPKTGPDEAAPAAVIADAHPGAEPIDRTTPVETVALIAPEDVPETAKALVAKAEPARTPSKKTPSVQTVVLPETAIEPETAAESVTAEEPKAFSQTPSAAETPSEPSTPAVSWTVPDDFSPATSLKERKGRWSVNALTNSSYGGEPGAFFPPMRVPGRAPMQTGVLETPGEDSDFHFPLTFGLGVRYRIAGGLSVGTGVQFTRLSRSFDGKFLQDGAEIKPADKILNYQDYIGIPLNLYYDVFSGSRLRSYVFAGGTVEKALYDKYRIPQADKDLFWKQDVDGVQFSAAAGVGLQYMILPQFSIYAEPDVRYFFDCDQPRSIRTEKPFQVTVSLGLRYDFR